MALYVCLVDQLRRRVDPIIAFDTNVQGIQMFFDESKYNLNIFVYNTKTLSQNWKKVAISQTWHPKLSFCGNIICFTPLKVFWVVAKLYLREPSFQKLFFFSLYIFICIEEKHKVCEKAKCSMRQFQLNLRKQRIIDTIKNASFVVLRFLVS